MTYRVLVVEDHELWRRYISSALEQAPQWEIVGVVSDGIEAVQKARELNPDVILLDVGLPSLNGIETARRILAHDLTAKILFVSEQQSFDIAEVALGTGARGYIVKTAVGRELLLAMDAVIEGHRFISARLAGRVFETTHDARAAREIRCHEVAFHADESSLVDEYARFATAALDARNGLMMLVNSARRDAIYQRLQARGIDIERIVKTKGCMWVDVPAALSRFMVDGRIDEVRFWNAASALVLEAAKASKGHPLRVAACGECAPSLLHEGMANAAIRLEQLWDEVARTYSIEVFCGYAADGLRCDDENQIFQDICAAHSAVHLR